MVQSITNSQTVDARLTKIGPNRRQELVHEAVALYANPGDLVQQLRDFGERHGVDANDFFRKANDTGLNNSNGKPSLDKANLLVDLLLESLPEQANGASDDLNAPSNELITEEDPSLNEADKNWAVDRNLQSQLHESTALLDEPDALHQTIIGMDSDTAVNGNSDFKTPRNLRLKASNLTKVEEDTELLAYEDFARNRIELIAKLVKTNQPLQLIDPVELYFFNKPEYPPDIDLISAEANEFYTKIEEKIQKLTPQKGASTLDKTDVAQSSIQLNTLLPELNELISLVRKRYKLSQDLTYGQADFQNSLKILLSQSREIYRLSGEINDKSRAKELQEILNTIPEMDDFLYCFKRSGIGDSLPEQHYYNALQKLSHLISSEPGPFNNDAENSSGYGIVEQQYYAMKRAARITLVDKKLNSRPNDKALLDEDARLNISKRIFREFGLVYKPEYESNEFTPSINKRTPKRNRVKNLKVAATVLTGGLALTGWGHFGPKILSMINPPSAGPEKNLQKESSHRLAATNLAAPDQEVETKPQDNRVAQRENNTVALDLGTQPLIAAASTPTEKEPKVKPESSTNKKSSPKTNEAKLINISSEIFKADQYPHEAFRGYNLNFSYSPTEETRALEVQNLVTTYLGTLAHPGFNATDQEKKLSKEKLARTKFLLTNLENPTKEQLKNLTGEEISSIEPVGTGGFFLIAHTKEHIYVIGTSKVDVPKIGHPLWTGTFKYAFMSKLSSYNAE